MQDEPLETINHPNGLRIDIRYDDGSMYNPSDDEGRVGLIIGWGRNPIGDEHVGPDVLSRYRGISELLNEYLIKVKHAAIALPVKVYSHSGEVISADPDVFNSWPDQQWDVAHCGYVYTTRAKCKKLTGLDPEKADDYTKIRQILIEEVKEYSAWMNGEIFRYEIVSPDDGDDVIQSGSGFYSYNECVQEAKDMATQLRSGVPA